jgi:hypothetical protein
MALKSFLGVDRIDEWRPKSFACRWGDVTGDESGNNADSGAASYSGGDYSSAFDSADSWSSLDSGNWGDTSGVSFGDAGVGSGGFGTGNFGGAFDGGGYYGGGNDSNFTGDLGGGGGWSTPSTFADYGNAGFGNYGSGGDFSSYNGAFSGGGGTFSDLGNWGGYSGVSYPDAPFSGGWDAYGGLGSNAGIFGGPSYGISGPGDMFGGLYGGLYGNQGGALSGMDLAGDFGPNAANMGNSLGSVYGTEPMTSIGGPTQGRAESGLSANLIGLAPPAALIAGVPGSVLGGAAIVGGQLGAMFGIPGRSEVTPDISRTPTMPEVSVVPARDVPNLANPSNFGPAQPSQSQFGTATPQAPSNAIVAQAAPPPPEAMQAQPNVQAAQAAPSNATNPYAPSQPSMALPPVEASKVGELVGTPGQVGQAAKSLLDMTPSQSNAVLLEAARPGSVQPPTIWDQIANFIAPSQAQATDDPTKAIADSLRVGPFAAVPGNQSAQQAQQAAKDQQWFTAASPTDKYLAEVYGRTPQKIDSSGDFTWKDAAAASRYNKGTAEYAVGGLDQDFKTILEAVGRAMDRAGIPWSLSAGYRDNYRQSITSGFRASTTGSMHGGTGRLGGDPKNPIGTYGRGQAVDITGVEPGAQKSDNGAVWNFIDKYGEKFGISRVMGGRDPPHVQPVGNFRQIAEAIRNGLDPMTVPARQIAQAGRGPGSSRDSRSAFGAGGQPGRSFVNGKEFTFYAPGTRGSAKGEGKFVGSRGNPLATLDDVREGKSGFVTLAGHPDQFGQEVFVGDITYKSPKDGKTYNLTGVRGIVGDTGGDFDSKDNPNKNKFDIATGDFRGIRGGAKFVSGNSVTAGTQVAAMPTAPAQPTPEETGNPFASSGRYAPPQTVAQSAPPPPEVRGVRPAVFETPQAMPGTVSQAASGAQELPQANPNARIAASGLIDLAQAIPGYLPVSPAIPGQPGQEAPQAAPPFAAPAPPAQEARGVVPPTVSPAVPNEALPAGEVSLPVGDQGGLEGQTGRLGYPSTLTDPGGLEGAVPGRSPIRSDWLVAQQEAGRAAFPGWPANPLMGGQYGGLPGADYGEGYGGGPAYAGMGASGVDESGMSGFQSPPNLPPISPQSPLAAASPAAPANPAFKSEPMLTAGKQFEKNSQDIRSKFSLTAEQKQAGKDFLANLTDKEKQDILDKKLSVMALIERKAVEQHPYAAKIVDVPAKAREFVQQNYPGGIRGLERDATNRDMTQPTPSGIQSELARAGGPEVYDYEQGTSTAMMPTTPSWIAPSAETAQPTSLAGLFGPPPGSLPVSTSSKGDLQPATFDSRFGQWSPKGDLQPNTFDTRFGDWAAPQAIMPEAPVQQAAQQAQSDPQTAQQIAQTNPAAVRQIAQQLGVDILTAAMVLALEEAPRWPHMPPGDNGSGFGRWPRGPTPDVPGGYAGFGREMVRRNYEAQNPINSLSAMMQSGEMRFNPDSWDAVMAHAPISPNVEDRRWFDPTMGTR